MSQHFTSCKQHHKQKEVLSHHQEHTCQHHCKGFIKTKKSNPSHISAHFKSPQDSTYNRDQSETNRIVDTSNTEDLLLDPQPYSSQIDLSESGSDINESLSVVLNSEKHCQPRSEHPIIATSPDTTVNCVNLSNVPQSCESITRNNQNCEVKR